MEGSSAGSQCAPLLVNQRCPTNPLDTSVANHRFLAQQITARQLTSGDLKPDLQMVQSAETSHPPKRAVSEPRRSSRLRKKALN